MTGREAGYPIEVELDNVHNPWLVLEGKRITLGAEIEVKVWGNWIPGTVRYVSHWTLHTKQEPGQEATEGNIYISIGTYMVARWKQGEQQP